MWARGQRPANMTRRAAFARGSKTTWVKHRVFYGGTCGAKGIVGEWSISGGLNGPFHIWPRTMGDMNELYLTEDLTVPTDQVDFSLAMAEEDSAALV